MKSLLSLTLAGLVIGCGPAEEGEEEGTSLSSVCYNCDSEDGWTGDNGLDDGGDGFATAISISLGSSFTDEINFYSDRDYFKFYQTAGVVTRVSVTGADCWLHYKYGTGYPPASYNDSNTDPTICYIQFTPPVSRTWYIVVARTDGRFGNQATTGASKTSGP
jgi:hypothetical protein